MGIDPEQAPYDRVDGGPRERLLEPVADAFSGAFGFGGHAGGA